MIKGENELRKEKRREERDGTYGIIFLKYGDINFILKAEKLTVHKNKKGLG